MVVDPQGLRQLLVLLSVPSFLQCERSAWVLGQTDRTLRDEGPVQQVASDVTST